MEHMKEDVLHAYMNEELDKQNRMYVEDHLEICDACLDLYLNVVEQWTLDTPSLSDDFTDQTFDQILEKQVMRATEKASSTNKKSTLLHYAIAAGLTIILMFSGVFQQMIQAFDEESIENTPSISDQLVDRTGKWLDKGLRLKGEDTNE